MPILSGLLLVLLQANCQLQIIIKIITKIKKSFLFKINPSKIILNLFGYFLGR